MMQKHGCCCFCPKCRGILHLTGQWDIVDQAGEYNVHCECGCTSNWQFGIAPVPLCIKYKPVRGSAWLCALDVDARNTERSERC